MATHKKKSTKPWVIALVEESNHFIKADRFFDNREDAERDWEENRSYHESHYHQIMTSEEFYKIKDSFKNK